MYRTACPSCEEEFESTTAAWCHCLNTDHSPICPHCRQCFCDASAAFRNEFWRDAPAELWEIRRELREERATIKPVLKKPLVLVVDDDAGIRALSIELISRLGYGCIVASKAASALRLVKRYHPDLVLTDLLMPGVDGRELARILKSDDEIPTPSVVCMTSVYRGETYEDEARNEFNVDAWLEKPVGLQELRQLLSELLPPAEESHANLSPSLEGLALEDLETLDEDLDNIVTS